MSTALHRRSLGAVVIAAVAAAGLLAGCGALGETLSQRSVTVVFVDDRTPADVTRVRETCDGVGGAKALPTGADNPTTRRYPLRFDVSGLDRKDRSKLVECLDRDPSVRGFQDSESTRG